MPTVASFHGCRAVVYPNDHRPAHVHVMGKGCEAVFVLNCPGGPPELRENYGFSRGDIATFQRELTRHLAHLCAQWRHFHGIPSGR